VSEPPSPRSQPPREWLDAGGQRVPLWTYGPPAGRPIVFLSGYGRPPADYHEILAALAGGLDRPILAPFLYANHGLARPPRTLGECVDLTRAFLASLVRAGRLRARDPDLFGHSTGGTVAMALGHADPEPASILAINPIFPVRFTSKVFGFLARSSRILGKQLAGLSGPMARGWGLLLRKGPRYSVNQLRNPSAAMALARDIGAFRLEDLARYAEVPSKGSIRCPVTIVYGRGDEYFDLPHDLEDRLADTCTDLRLRILDDRNSHEWLLMAPALGAVVAARALGDVEPRNAGKRDA